MSAKGVAAGLLIISLVSAVSGCGSSDRESESNQWLNEVILVNGDLAEKSRQHKKEIASAQTVGELSAAYSAYVKVLQQHLDEFEEVEPPEICRDEQAVMKRFMRETIAVTEGLADQENLTPVGLERLEERTSDAVSRYRSALEEIVTRKTC